MSIECVWVIADAMRHIQSHVLVGKLSSYSMYSKPVDRNHFSFTRRLTGNGESNIPVNEL